MRSAIFCGLMASAALALSGCNGGSAQSSQADIGNDIAANAEAAPSMPASNSGVEQPDVPDGAATNALLPKLSSAQSSPTDGAADIVRNYYADIDQGDFKAAYALWGNDGKNSHQSFNAFRQGFAKTESTSVTTGSPSSPEGAAGSLYIRVPVKVKARLKDGTNQRFSGEYTLRRANDVPGATAEQERWHLYSADLKQA
ncbi:hypothetical protein GCM10023219_04550 [Stakelama sediminis]|uniref:Lipoprotein n=1 Tax=Stakelama sediminis TaxID=463200 RepID=A0A840YUD7_9SPHN|nr:hypothetical protein [Stakelama sediminis]MBB5717169.1 hypothetical protein [Stakelama sediminis]